MPLSDDLLPSNGTNPWYQPFVTAWDALRALVNGIEANTPQRVIVVTGSEARPNTPGPVDWIDTRAAGASAPTAIDSSRGDLWYAPLGTTPPSATAPNIATTTLNSLVQGQPFSQTIAVTGTAPVTLALASGSSLPAGLSLDPTTRVISGTPTTTGAFSFSLEATNAAGSDTQAYSGTVAASATTPEITTTALSALQVGQAFNQTIGATGTTPLTWAITAGALPAGLTRTNNVISGTPTTEGSYSFTLQATNSAGSDTQVFSGTVAAAPAPGAYDSIFGSTIPAAVTVGDDGGGNIRTGNRFYTTITEGVDVAGVRVYAPAGASGAYLTEALTVEAYLQDWVGSRINGSATYALSPTVTKTRSAARNAGEWTDILFDTPIHLNPLTASGVADDLLTLAVRFANGQHYAVVQTTYGGGASVQSPTRLGLYLSEFGPTQERAIHNLAFNDGNVESGTIYAIDILVEA